MVAESDKNGVDFWALSGMIISKVTFLFRSNILTSANRLNVLETKKRAGV